MKHTMALELVAGPLLGAVFNVLLERIASSEVVNFFKSKNSDRLLKRLKIILLSVNAVLNDAEEKQMKNESVKEWLEELKDVAFAADDLLDEICTDAEIKAKEVNTLHSTSMKFYDKGLEEKIEDVHEKLEFIIKQKEVLDLKLGKEVKVAHKTPTSSVIEASDVYGRDGDKEALVNMVLSHDAHDEKIGVIPIVGMGGIGKTTLAQLIYNDYRVQKEFDLKAWIYVSEEFDICKITKNLLEVVTSCSCDIEDLNSLQRNLKMYLQKKRFLFVLDDVWDENYDNWDKFRSPFKHEGALGSKIIVTTRSGHVASIMQTVPPYYLSELSNEYSWNLFSKHAFDYGDSSVHRSLEKVGREIVRKCKGLPLAVKTLAGLLRSKSDKQEWYKVLNSEIWDLQDRESNILPALRLSYHYLPSHLKRCFAYCAIFPKDYEFEKENLILLWMAEGFLQQSKRHRRIEEVGNEYFCELVSRSFFQQPRRGKPCFLMHHLVNDLAQFVSGTFSVRIEGNNSNEVEERTRHLSHIVADSSSCLNLKDVSKAKHLRTILQIRPIGTSIDLFNNTPNDLLTKLTCLRVLSLVGAHIYSLPDSIDELKHLRSLEVFDTQIVRLPESICSLFNLQTLKLVGCYNLVELPKGIHKLVNLRYLDITKTCLRWMPLHMSELRSLQKLSDFFVGEYGSSIGELGELSSLHGTLCIHYIEHIGNCKDSVKAKLKEKHGLEKLSLEWGGSGDTDNSKHEKTILDSLQPHTNLKELDIYHYPSTEFPDWLGDHSFCNLVSLQLKGSKYCYKLPPLGQLPLLKELHIIKFEGLVNVGSEFHGNRNSSATDSFPALEILRIEYMSAWEKWCHYADNAGSRAFCHLRELHIESCPKLIGDLPGNLPSLTLLLIRDCKALLCSIPKAPALRVLNIQNCENLEFPVHAPWYHQSLTSLFLHGSCDSLMLLPLDLFPNLKSLDIWGCKNLEALTVSASNATPPNFKSLHSIWIRHCPKFTSFPKGGFAAPKLTLLTINYCEKLNSLPEQITNLMPNLKQVQLRGCPKIESSTMRPLRIRICKLLEGKQNHSDPLFARLEGLATVHSPSSR
ncbi:putative disease resistance RPP13-like protein 1 [Abrus precatorius]|uniref:Disease resistance RPP13-like protein 1 n=1 Tax=Abrus precatorius TaxID=3816 RepID=A0A8B8MFE2_ABRPR|nr:putative disease resistance RPP13-like protein 1 [Abrus precatorius]